LLTSNGFCRHIDFKKKIMERPASERFEVRVSRWKAALISVTCFTLTVVMAVLANAMFREFKYALGVGWLNVIILAIASAACAGLWLRRRPFWVIDDQGVTDCGFLGKGFGLIGWQNIEGITKWGWSPGGPILLMKVNNYDELLSQRNPLIQPFLLLSGRYNGSIGGQISLSILWSDTNLEIVGQQISYYSKNRF